MSFRLTGIAVAILIVLGGVVWFTEFRDKGGAEATAQDKPELEVLKFDDQDLKSLEVKKADQQVRVEKDGQGNWTLQPSGEPGDRLRISSVTTRLANLQATRRVADDATDLAQYGLDNPPLVTTVTKTDGSTLILQVGAKTPAGTGTYAKRADDSAVYLIPNQLGTDLERLVTEPPIQPPTPTPAPIPSPSPNPVSSPTGD